MLMAVAALLVVLPAGAQYPGQVTKSGQDAPTVRAVGVLEWTGEEGHPKASRLVPVTVFDGQDLQDGGIYLARPAPLALSNEVEYELKQDGKTVGLFDINSAGQEQGSWVGFGVWKPLPKSKPAATKTAQSGSKDVWGDDTQSDRPTLHRKAHSGDAKDAGAGDRGDSSGSAGQAADPDRPTLHKKTSSDSNSDASTASTSSSSAPDPDRPTLSKKSAKKVEDVGYVESLPDSTASDRPRLMRGKPAEQGGAVLPTLMGLPPDMHQSVAVSDAKNRPEHLWSYSWSNPDDEAKMKAEMEDIARKALGLTPIPPPAPPASKRTTTPASRKTRLASAPPPAPLVDEQFRVFELAYGSGATMVLTAHTDGQGTQQKFVTLVAQPDLYGKVVVLLKSVTDAAHLDDAPRMRLVDAVDAMADNRGELLFELRGATQRQFALYRVLRGQVNKLFVSGPGAIASPVNE
ncbi:MAG TPA: hypothetical protein VGT08_19315 [Terracidiphilus sp.]|nr:hypothetical protein [Terracidiphilus sp.]